MRKSRAVKAAEAQINVTVALAIVVIIGSIILSPKQARKLNRLFK